jgi:hypothetical protein
LNTVVATVTRVQVPVGAEFLRNEAGF